MRLNHTYVLFGAAGGKLGDGTILFGAGGKMGDENEDEIENRIKKENKNMVHCCHCTTADTLQMNYLVMNHWI